MAPLAGLSEGDIRAIQCADYTLRDCWICKGTFLVSGFGGNGAGCGAVEEPFEDANMAVATKEEFRPAFQACCSQEAIALARSQEKPRTCLWLLNDD